MESGADGVGLLRTELLVLDSAEDYPDEDTQTSDLVEIFAGPRGPAGGRPGARCRR